MFDLPTKDLSLHTNSLPGFEAPDITKGPNLPQTDNFATHFNNNENPNLT